VTPKVLSASRLRRVFHDTIAEYLGSLVLSSIATSSSGLLMRQAVRSGLLARHGAESVA